MMYRDEILDLYRNPRNEGSLETEFVAEGENPSCGDHTEVFLEVENGEVNEMRHETEGCAICTASASVVSEQIKGLKTGEVRQLDRDWVLDKLGIEVSPMRLKCALLSLKTAKKAIETGEK